MALYLLLEDFAGAMGGPTNVQLAQAGTLFDDAVFNIPALLANGCPLILYDAGTMAAPVAAFQKMSGGLAQINPDGNLLALLLAVGAIPSGGGGGIVGPLSTVYVEPPTPTGRGDDATGERGNAAKPFATLDAAFAAMQNGDTLALAAGTYAPPTNPIPTTLLSAVIRCPSGAGATVIDGTGTTRPCLDFGGGARELWNVYGLRLQHDPGQLCLSADGSAAAKGQFFGNGALALAGVVIIGGDVLTRYVASLVGPLMTMPTGGTWQIDTCGSVLFNGCTLIDVAMEVTTDNDDPLSPASSGPNPPVRFDGATVFPTGTITLGEQGGVYSAPGSVLPQVTGSGLTKSLMGFFSQVSLFGTVSLIDFSNLGALPDIQGVVDLTGVRCTGQCNIEQAAGSLNTAGVAAAGAFFGSFVVAGEQTRWNLQNASFPSGILNQLTTTGSGIVIPPAFCMPPQPVVSTPATTDFVFPFACIANEYVVALDYDAAGNGLGSVTTRTPGGFSVDTGVSVPTGNVRCAVSYYGF